MNVFSSFVDPKFLVYLELSHKIFQKEGVYACIYLSIYIYVCLYFFMFSFHVFMPNNVVTDS